MFLAVLLFCVAATPWSLGQKVHEQMSAQQVAEIFQTRHDSVPKYEVVQFNVPRLNKRALGELEALKIVLPGNNVNLWLKPTEGVLAGQNTPVYMVNKNPRDGKLHYRELVGAMKNVGLILEDPVTKATLLARTDAGGQYSFNGFIGSKNLIVRSLPEAISNDLVRNSSSHNSESSGHKKSAYHVVFKREVKDSHTPLDHFQLAEKRTVGLRAKTARILPRSLPKVVYPECMVVVDWSLLKMYTYDIEKVLMYVLAFWNGVDLLYRAFDEPKFRFNIPRIIIPYTEEATPYLSDHMTSPKVIDAYSALQAATGYFYSIRDIFPTSSYDAIVVMTSSKMADSSGKPNILGLAEVGGACGVNHKAKRVTSVALTYDDGTFQGVATAAHEFAHLRNGGFCFYNEPIVTDPLPRGYLPGVATSRDRQCELMGHGRSCYVSSKWQEPCTIVYCHDKIYPKVCTIEPRHAPPDGAFCEPGMICLHGKCVRL